MTDTPLPKRLLVANRGEIAMRVIRSAHELGIETVAVYSEADREALPVRRATFAAAIGGASPQDSYLRGDRILEVAKRLDCDAIHPGYGFLSENAGFAEACAAAGIVFVGPPVHAIRTMGDKVAARRAAEAAGVPLVPGVDRELQPSELAAEAEQIGYPVMLKAAAGGGGKGIRIVHESAGLQEAYDLARAEAESSFNDGRIYLEKFVTRPRHVEVQVFGDQHGNAVHWGERECSVQRRHQKVVEESPSMALTPELREEMGQAACQLAKAVGYVGAGTVEFLYSEGAFYFLEMNTRLQVEHPISEIRYGADFVCEQLRVAMGARVSEPGEPRGHAIEIRINAEDPETFFPSLGTVERMNLPGGPGVRVDSALYRGMPVTPHYDSMIAKLIVHGTDREHAIERARRALGELRLVGLTTTVPVALRVFENDEFRSGDYDTGILERVNMAAPANLSEVAALAAAVARFQRTERFDDTTADANVPALGNPWTMIDRLERCGGRPR